MSTSKEKSDSRMASLLDLAGVSDWATTVGGLSALVTLRVESSQVASAPTPRVVPAVGGEGAPAEYEVTRRIGEGGMGVVFEARQISLGRTVALKMIRPTLQDNPSAQARFFAEASLTGVLEHPGIVTVFDSGITDRGRAFYAMRLVKGQPWCDTLRSRSLDENLAIWAKVVEAVGFAHGEGIIHNDLKPANIFIDNQNNPWVGDWGLAARVDSDGKIPAGAPHVYGGTPAYMSPEVARHDGKPSVASDIYLLGSMLYEVLFGCPPHTGENAKACLQQAVSNQIDFCQLQLNYLDTEYEAGLLGMKYAADRGLGVAIMEPLMGGYLANVPAGVKAIFDVATPTRTPAEWSFDYLWDMPEVGVVLSGMSAMAHVEENMASAMRSSAGMLTVEDRQLLGWVIDQYATYGVPCVGCEYCDPCPHNVAIAQSFKHYNQYVATGDPRWRHRYLNLPGAYGLNADHCVGCGECEPKCPYHIAVRERFKEVQATMKG